MATSSKPQMNSGLVPHLTVHDAASAIDFYKRAFGATEIMRAPAPDGKRLMHASVMINGSPLMLNDDFPEYSGKPRTPQALGGSPVTLHLNVPDVDAAWQRAVKAGAEITMPLADQFWGDRYGTLRDPFGHDWSLGMTKTKPLMEQIRKGAEKAFSKASSAMDAKWPKTGEPAASKVATAKAGAAKTSSAKPASARPSAAKAKKARSNR